MVLKVRTGKTQNPDSWAPFFLMGHVQSKTAHVTWSHIPAMGSDFCNLTSLGCLIGQYLAPLSHREQRERHAYRVDREEEGMSSNRPELVVLRECLEAQQDHENLLYLTDSESTLQVIN